MSREIEVDMYAGGLVFWKSTMLPVAVLDAACKEVGLEVSWYMVNEVEALKLALLDTFRRTGVMVRPTKPVEMVAADGSVDFRPAFVTVAEQAGNKQNDYANLQCYWLDKEFNVWTVDSSGVEQVEPGIDAKRYRDMVLGNEVSVGMERLVRQIGGYKLRDNARIYYMPTARMAGWNAVVSAFEKLGVQFFRANCPADSETAAAVADNAVEELRERYRKALEEITACDQQIAEVSQQPAKGAKAQRAASRKIGKAADKRAALLAQLELVKQEAATIDASFRGLLSLAGEIGNEIDTAMAMAVLATAN